jgi:HEAT repeat protein
MKIAEPTSEPKPAQLGPTRTRWPWAAYVMIAITAAACLTALIFRTPLRSRFWAWQIVRSDDPAQRAIYLTALCNAGDAGRWGTSVLLADGRAEIRQLGVVVLQHVRSPWARAALLRFLADPDESARELAALGLAIHGDSSIIPTLKQMYRQGDPGAATAACVALERLGAAEAVAALDELSRDTADEVRRAALVDALDSIGAPNCVPALLGLLADHRTCSTPSRQDRLSRGVLDKLAAAGQLSASMPATTTQSAAETIAERAAAALARITSLNPPFSSAGSDSQRQQAARQWADWYEQQTRRP